MSAESRLTELGLVLPPVPKAGGIYQPVVQVGNLLYVSGHGPMRSDGTLITGKVGLDLTEEQGFEAARAVGLTLLATVRNALGSLNRIQRTIKTLGMVNATADFTRHPAVINGFSQLLKDLFGEDGVGARSAVGMGSLPGNIAVEVEVIFELKD